MTSRARKRRPPTPLEKPLAENAGGPLGTYSGRKRPWLLALAATLAAGWIVVLVLLAWHG